MFRSLRHGPKGEQVFAIVHMDGQEVPEFDPVEQDVPGLEGDNWRVAVRTPPIGSDYLGGPIARHDSMGVIYTRDSRA